MFHYRIKSTCILCCNLELTQEQNVGSSTVRQRKLFGKTGAGIHFDRNLLIKINTVSIIVYSKHGVMVSNT